jgi:hypothetical protein
MLPCFLYDLDNILNQKRFLYSFSCKPLKINIISQENLKNHFNHSIISTKLSRALVYKASDS